MSENRISKHLASMKNIAHIDMLSFSKSFFLDLLMFDTPHRTTLIASSLLLAGSAS